LIFWSYFLPLCSPENNFLARDYLIKLFIIYYHFDLIKKPSLQKEGFNYFHI